MSKDILMVVEAISNERGVDKSEIFKAVEAALATVTAKQRYAKEDVLLRVEIDTKTGDYKTYRQWVVVPDDEADQTADTSESASAPSAKASTAAATSASMRFQGAEPASIIASALSSEELAASKRPPILVSDITPETVLAKTQKITLSNAQKFDVDLKVGDIVEEMVESIAFGRIAAQQARQVIIQKVRDAERARIVDKWRERVGTLAIGVVKKVTRDSVTLDLGNNSEGLLPRDEMIPREIFRVNDRVRAYITDVRHEKRGPHVALSRICPEFLVELFKIEVPEIAEEVIEVMGAARDPGSRAKIAVKTNDGRIDPIGACVGMRGSRVQAVSNELNGERVDIVLWDDSPAQLVINAMSPAEISSIVVDEETHSIDLVVTEEQLSQAIGRSGQNVRLASDLTGWELNLLTEEQAQEKTESETGVYKKLFMEKLDVDEEVADLLVAEGFTSLEDLAYVPIEELQEIEEFDEAIAEELQQRASDVLLTQEIATQEAINEKQPEADLYEVDGMTDEIAASLARHDILCREALAEQSVDELKDILEIDDALAAKLIMSAREPWFK